MLNRIRVSAFLRLMVRKEFDETLVVELSRICKIGWVHPRITRISAKKDSVVLGRWTLNNFRRLRKLFR